MLFDIKDKFLNFITNRMVLLYVVLIGLASLMLYRIFNLQIINGDDYMNNFTLSIEKEVDIPSTRGNIYDCNGVLLAYNDLAYTVTIIDTIESGTGKNETLNNIIYNMNNIIKANGDQIECDFSIYLDEDGNYKYSVSDTTLLRFLADVYGHAATVDLLYSEKTANPDEVIAYLASAKKYGIGGYLESENGESFAIGMGYTKEDILDIIKVRYNLSLNGYQKYISTTVSTQVCEKTVADIMENSMVLPGVKIEEQSIRKYNSSVYFSPIIGYVGKISQAEYEEYSAENDNYSNSDMVGKTGIEYSMESYLQGKKGSETIYVDNLGKIIETTNIVGPVAGNDVYLTIDSELQIAMYDLVEEKIASILVTKIRNVKTVENEGRNPLIPIYDVYFALFNNNVINLGHLSKDYAGENEKKVYQAFKSRQSTILEEIRNQMMNSDKAYKDLSNENQVYQSFIIQMLSSSNYGVIDSSLVDTSDETYTNWKINESISIKEYLNYCIANQWINIRKLNIEDEYADSAQIYKALVDYTIEKLAINSDFSKKIIKYMLLNDSISPRQVCMILWEQDIIQVDSKTIDRLKAGSISSYDFIVDLITTMKITPAQLGLEPCSGSMVITDVNNGQVLALVSYPGYDNNKISGNTDSSYLARLNADMSKPLWNYATQQKTAPGSTFKMVSSTAGVMENVISTGSTITCTGVFDKLNGTIHKCHIYPGSHGSLNVSGAITKSCNCFFYEVGYRLAFSDGVYNDGVGIDKLAKYADLYGLSEKSGVEISESEPAVSDQYPVASAIGQGTNSYTTVGLARYVTAIANNGTVYNLSLIKDINDAKGNEVYKYAPDVRNVIDLPDTLWNSIHSGMKGVVDNKAYFNTIDLQSAGKTGTAQEAANKANHALFVGYAPYSNPEISVAIRIANGYTSDYAAQVCLDVYKYYFGLSDEEEIITGTATALSGAIGGD